MVRHYRNSPSVVMWSIGNEVPSQWGPVGMDELVMLRDKVRRLDTTRPITCGMDQIDAAGNVAAERTVVTAGKPHHLVVSANREHLAADGADLVYFTVRVADRNGNIVPTESRKVSFEMSGAGSFEATANGDPTCLMPFQNPEMKLFSGAATAIARSATQAGTPRFTVKAKGVKPATVEITVR